MQPPLFLSHSCDMIKPFNRPERASIDYNMRRRSPEGGGHEATRSGEEGQALGGRIQADNHCALHAVALDYHAAIGAGGAGIKNPVPPLPRSKPASTMHRPTTNP